MSIEEAKAHPSPFFWAPPTSRGVARLQVTPTLGQHPPLSNITQTLEARLDAAGLPHARLPGVRIGVVGGTAIVQGGGIGGFERGFVILQREDGGFHAEVAATRGFPSREARVRTALAAVEAVLAIYRERGLIGSRVP